MMSYDYRNDSSLAKTFFLPRRKMAFSNRTTISMDIFNHESEVVEGECILDVARDRLSFIPSRGYMRLT